MWRRVFFSKGKTAPSADKHGALVRELHRWLSARKRCGRGDVPAVVLDPFAGAGFYLPDGPRGAPADYADASAYGSSLLLLGTALSFYADGLQQQGALPSGATSSTPPAPLLALHFSERDGDTHAALCDAVRGFLRYAGEPQPMTPPDEGAAADVPVAVSTVAATSRDGDGDGDGVCTTFSVTLAAAERTAGLEVVVRRSACEAALLRHHRAQGLPADTFAFLDPYGCEGFRCQDLRDLLRPPFSDGISAPFNTVVLYLATHTLIQCLSGALAEPGERRRAPSPRVVRRLDRFLGGAEEGGEAACTGGGAVGWRALVEGEQLAGFNPSALYDAEHKRLQGLRVARFVWGAVPAAAGTRSCGGSEEPTIDELRNGKSHVVTWRSTLPAA